MLEKSLEFSSLTLRPRSFNSVDPEAKAFHRLQICIYEVIKVIGHRSSLNSKRNEIP